MFGPCIVAEAHRSKRIWWLIVYKARHMPGDTPEHHKKHVARIDSLDDLKEAMAVAPHVDDYSLRDARDQILREGNLKPRDPRSPKRGPAWRVMDFDLYLLG